MNASHSFSVSVAKQYDVNSALLLQHFLFWYLKNKADNVNFFKGDYWVRMKVETLCGYFPYLTPRQLRYVIEKLVENRLIKTGEFNQKKNDRTKWYSFTKNGKKLLNISTDKIVTNKGDKNVTNVTHKIVTPTDKIVTSIYKEVDIEYRYYYILENLQNNFGLIEDVAMKNKLQIETVKQQVIAFAKFCQNYQQPVHSNNKDLFVHFSSWVRKQKLSDVDCNEEVNWFIEKFNKISKREFVVTDDLKRLFLVQLENGFTGKQMITAVKNMYSSNVKNAFHLKHSFKFATPEYLLKEGNLNKYLNVKY